jgi:hypothetical protein
MGTKRSNSTKSNKNMSHKANDIFRDTLREYLEEHCTSDCRRDGCPHEDKYMEEMGRDYE